MEEMEEIPQIINSEEIQNQNPIQQIQNQEDKENNVQQKIQTDQVPQQNIEEAEKQQESQPLEDQKAIMDRKKVEKLYLEIKALIAFRMSKDDKVPAEIIENLYLGSIGSALSKKMLLQLKITHIVTAMDKMKNAFDDSFKYKSIKLADSQTQNVKMYFEESNKFIHEVLESRQKVLVHCFAGKSRSTTLIIAYLICYKKMTRDEALALIKQKRPVAQPNMNFMRQLLEYEGEIFKRDIDRQQNESEGKIQTDYILEDAIEEKELDPQILQDQEILNDQQDIIQQNTANNKQLIDENIIKQEEDYQQQQLQTNLENVILHDQVDQPLNYLQEQNMEQEPQIIQILDSKKETKNIQNENIEIQQIQKVQQQIEKSEEEQLNLDQKQKQKLIVDQFQPNNQDKE